MSGSQGILLPAATVKTLYRTTDPHTSGEAADAHDARGHRGRHAERVLAVLRSWPGLTAGEVGLYSGLGHIEAQRRLSDLKNAHRVRQGDARVCREKGTRMVTWFLVEVGS